MKRLFWTIICAVLTVCVYAQSRYEVISSTNLNVRSAPDSKALVIGSLKPGEIVTVLSVSDDWAEVPFHQQKGYAAVRFLKLVNLQESIAPSDSSIIRRWVYDVISTSRLNVRDKPSTQSQVLGTLTPGFRIETGEEVGDWLKFEYNGVESYVSLRFLKKEEIIEQIVVETVQEEPELVAVEETIVVEDAVDITPSKNRELPEFLKHKFLFNKPCLTSEKIDLMLSGRIGIGLSSYSWKDGTVNGKIGLSLDAVAQMYWKNGVNYYTEASLGYALKGAANLPMHYLNIGLSPLGYYYDFNEIRFVGNAGFYMGCPLSSLAYVQLSKFDLGLCLAAAIEYNMFSIGLEYNHGLMNISASDVNLKNWGLMAKITCKIMSFNN